MVEKNRAATTPVTLTLPLPPTLPRTLTQVRAAVNEFRTSHNIAAPLLPVPSDYVLTCTPDLSDERVWEIGGAAERRLTTATRVAAAYWQKPAEEPAAK